MSIGEGSSRIVTDLPASGGRFSAPLLEIDVTLLRKRIAAVDRKLAELDEACKAELKGSLQPCKQTKTVREREAVLAGDAILSRTGRSEYDEFDRGQRPDQQQRGC
jgi:hypothetical protein